MSTTDLVSAPLQPDPAPGPASADPTVALERAKRRLARERTARHEVERIAERATRELYERQQDLQLLEYVASAANAAATVEDALQAAVDKVCEYAGWPIGHVWLRSSAGSTLRSTSIWHLDGTLGYERFREATDRLSLEAGCGLPGEVMGDGEPRWITNVTEDASFVRAEPAIEVGIRAALAAPVRAGAEVAGVLEFFSSQLLEPDERLLSVIAQVGTQLGRVIERVRAEEQRRAAQEQLARHHERLEELVAERTAALSAAMAELEAFSYSVSHDLRAPLRGIDGFSQALLEDYGDRLDERGADYLARVRTGTQRMGTLIDGLLLLARVSRGEARRDRVDLSMIAAELVEELQTASPQRVVQTTIAPGLVAQGDPAMLKAVLQNLIGNAWKFTGKRENARIEVGATRVEGDEVFFVADNGAGFDPAYAGNLFAPFTRLHAAAEFEGTGIGLATVRRIVNRHGGRAWAEGEAGQGARFLFTVPASAKVAL